MIMSDEQRAGYHTVVGLVHTKNDSFVPTSVRLTTSLTTNEGLIFLCRQTKCSFVVPKNWWYEDRLVTDSELQTMNPAHGISTCAFE